MTEDLMERLQPHIDNPELRRREQEKTIQEEQEEQEREKKEKQERIVEMIEEIEEVAIAIRTILQNFCSITIAKKMQNEEGMEGMVNVIIKSPKGKTSVVVGGFSFEGSVCLKKGLKIVTNQKVDMIIRGFDDSCIEIIHDFLSTDNVKVTYE